MRRCLHGESGQHQSTFPSACISPTHAAQWMGTLALRLPQQTRYALRMSFKLHALQSRHVIAAYTPPELVLSLCTPPVAVSEQQGRCGKQEQSGKAACGGTMAEDDARGHGEAPPAADHGLPAHARLCIQVPSLTVI